MGVRKKKVEALRAAMELLLSGERRITNGDLTWVNVHTEAGVPKATADRAHDVKQEWKDALSRRVRPAQSAVYPQNEAEASEEENSTSRTIRGLRNTTHIMANHIQALVLAVERLEVMLQVRDETIASLHRQLADATGSNVIPLPKRD
jgi:hypothetical protein